MWYFCQVQLKNIDMHVMLHIFCSFILRNDGSEFGGSIYQKVNDQLETAVNLAWTAGSNGTRFGIAAKYQLDSSASISVSVFFFFFLPPLQWSYVSCLSAGYLKTVLKVKWTVVGN